MRQSENCMARPTLGYNALAATYVNARNVATPYRHALTSRHGTAAVLLVDGAEDGGGRPPQQAF